MPSPCALFRLLLHVLMKDRLQHGGPSQAFGDGDTPLLEILEVLRASDRPIPALVEYDYPGLRTAVQEVATAIAYLARRPGASTGR